MSFNNWSNTSTEESLHWRTISFSATTLSGLFLHDLASDIVNQKNNIQKETGKAIYVCDMQQDYNNVWTCSIFCDSSLIGQAKGKKKPSVLCQAFEDAAAKTGPSNPQEDILSKIPNLNTVCPKSNDFPMYIRKKKVGEILLLLDICMKERGLPYTTGVQQGFDGSFICSIYCNSVLICRASESSRCNAMRLAAGGTIDTLIKSCPLEDKLIKSNQKVTPKKEVTSNKNNKEVKSNQNEVISKKKEVTSKNIQEVTSNKNEVTSKKMQEVTSNKNEMTSNKNEVTSNKNEVTSNKNEVTSNKNEVTSGDKQEVKSNIKQEVTSNKNQEVSSNSKLEMTSNKSTEQVAALNDSCSDLRNDDADSFPEETKDNNMELHLGNRFSNPPSRKIPFDRIIPVMDKFPQRSLFPHQRAIPAFMQHVAQSHHDNRNVQNVAYNRETPVMRVAPQPVDLTSQVPQNSVDQPKFQQNQKQVPKRMNKQSDILQRLDTCMKEHNLEYTYDLQQCPDKKYECTVYCNSDLFIHVKGKDKLSIRYLALQQAIAKVRKTYGYVAAKRNDTTNSSTMQETNIANISSSPQLSTKEDVSIEPTDEMKNEEDLIIFEDNDMDLCNEDEYSEPQIELTGDDQYHSLLNKNADDEFFSDEWPDTWMTQEPTNLTAEDTLHQVYESEEESTSSKGLWPWERPQKISSAYISVLSKMSQENQESSNPMQEDSASSFHSFPFDKDISLEQRLDSCMKERGFNYSYYLKQFSDKSYLCSVFCDSTLFHRSRGKDVDEAQTLAFERTIAKLRKCVKIKEEPRKDTNDLFTLKGPDKSNRNINVNQDNKNKDRNVAPGKKVVISNLLKQVRSDRIVNEFSKKNKKDDKMDVKREKPVDDILFLKKIDKRDDKTGMHGTDPVVSSTSLKHESSNPNKNSSTKESNKRDDRHFAHDSRSVLASNSPRHERSNHNVNSAPRRSNKREEIIFPASKDAVTSNRSRQERSNHSTNSSLRQSNKREDKSVASGMKDIVTSSLKISDPDENSYSKWFGKREDSGITPPRAKDIGTPNSLRNERASHNEKSLSKWSDKREERVTASGVKAPLTSNSLRQERSNRNENSSTKWSAKRNERMAAPAATKDLATSNNLRQERCDVDENSYTKWFGKITPPLTKDTGIPNTPRLERSDIEAAYAKWNKSEERIAPSRMKDIAAANTPRKERCDDENSYSKWSSKREERITHPSMKDIAASNSLRWERPEPTENSFSKRINKRERSISPYQTKEIKKNKIDNFILLEDSKFKQNDPYSILRRSAAFNKVYLWPKFHKVDENENPHKCSLMVGDELLTEAEGTTSGEAQYKASLLALTKLKTRRPTIKIFSYDT